MFWKRHEQPCQSSAFRRACLMGSGKQRTTEHNAPALLLSPPPNCSNQAASEEPWARVSLRQLQHMRDATVAGWP